MIKVLMVAAEAAPFAKTGGLGDVVGALPAALGAHGVEAAVVIPRHRTVPLEGAERVASQMPVPIGPRTFGVEVWLSDWGNVPFFFLDNRELYDREGPYGDRRGAYWDNPTRFAVLSRGALEVARRFFRPNLVHCHDWHAALAPVYLRTRLGLDPTFFGVKTVLTIHNLGDGYQGRFGPWTLGEMGLDESVMRPDLMEFYGDVCVLKGGIVYSDAITTVSRKYAEEIQTPEFGAGLDGLLRARSNVLTGILNGVDYSVWNPETDPHIVAHYSARDLSGKRLCKRDLLTEFGFPAEVAHKPLAGIISRLAWQKGFDLIEAAEQQLLEMDFLIAGIGSGEERFEELFRRMMRKAPDRVSFRAVYDERLAHKIEAGADFFLMPSRYEPCGLNQIYSLRYGTLPVVHATGGLDDTIDPDTGFKFRPFTPEAFLGAVREALARYRDPEAWGRMMRTAMSRDFSWDVSARQYAELYRRILNAGTP